MKHYYFVLQLFLLSWMMGGSFVEAGACTEPTLLEISHSNVTYSSVTLGNIATGTARRMRLKATTSSQWWVVSMSGSFSTSVEVTTLLPGTTYEYQGSVECGGGGLWSAWSQSKTFTTPQLSHSNVTYNSVQLSTTATASGFQFAYKLTASSNWQLTESPYTNQKTIIGLAASSTYEYTVRQLDSNNVWSAWYWSPLNTFTTQAATCTAPTNSEFSDSNVTETSAQLSTSAVGSAFRFRYKPTSSSVWTWTAAPFDSTKTVYGLQPNTSYHYDVRRQCSNGVWSNWSPSQTFTTANDVINATWEAAKPARELHVFPNPASEVFTVRLPERIEVLSLHDASGRLLRRIDPPAGSQIAISADGLGQGLILLSAIDTEGRRWYAKVVLNTRQ